MSFGSIIYLFLRPTKLILFDYTGDVLKECIEAFRLISLTCSLSFPSWVLFSLPDGLYIYSYVNLMLYIWDCEITANNLIWYLAVPLYVLVNEFMQFANLVSGVFDPVDLIFYVIFFFIPFWLNKRKIRNSLYGKNCKHISR